MDYADKMSVILKAIGIRTLDEETNDEASFRRSVTLSPVSNSKIQDAGLRLSKSETDLGTTYWAQRINHEHRQKLFRSQSCISTSSASFASQMNHDVIHKMQDINFNKCSAQVCNQLL